MYLSYQLTLSSVEAVKALIFSISFLSNTIRHTRVNSLMLQMGVNFGVIFLRLEFAVKAFIGRFVHIQNLLNVHKLDIDNVSYGKRFLCCIGASVSQSVSSLAQLNHPGNSEESRRCEFKPSPGAAAHCGWL